MIDYDNEYGNWLEDTPYYWSPEDNVENSKRFYIIHANAAAVFTEDNKICDIPNIFSNIFNHTLTGKETYSLFDNKEKNRNMNLVYIFENNLVDLYNFNKKIKGLKYEINFPYKITDLRIQGKSIKDYKLKGFGKLFRDYMINIIDKNNKIIEKKLIYPWVFGNFLANYNWKYDKSKKGIQIQKDIYIKYDKYNGIKNTIIYKNKKYRNLIEVKEELNINNDEITKIHNEAIEDKNGWYYEWTRSVRSYMEQMTISKIIYYTLIGELPKYEICIYEYNPLPQEIDYDNEYGNWIEDTPYYWCPENNIENSKRFYIIHPNAAAVFTEDNKICDRHSIETAIFNHTLTGKETYSLFDNKEKNRNMNLVYILGEDLTQINNLYNFNKKIKGLKYEINFPYKITDLRIQGKSIKDYKLKGFGKLFADNYMINIIDKNNKIIEKKLIYPWEFSIDKMNIINNGIIYKNKTYRNLIEVKEELNLDKEQLKKIHNDAIEDKNGWYYEWLKEKNNKKITISKIIYETLIKELPKYEICDFEKNIKEIDYDNEYGKWIKDTAYYWCPGDNIENSKRFYIIHPNDAAVFTEDNKICDIHTIETAIFNHTLTGKETYSLFDNKEKNRNMNLVYIFDDRTNLYEFNKKIKGLEYEIIFPYKIKDLRIQGKSIKNYKLPHFLDLFPENIVNIIDNNKIIDERFIYPFDFGNINNKNDGVYNPIIHKGDKTYRNLQQVKEELNLNNNEVTKIHNDALNKKNEWYYEWILYKDKNNQYIVSKIIYETLIGDLPKYEICDFKVKKYIRKESKKYEYIINLNNGKKLILYDTQRVKLLKIIKIYLNYIFENIEIKNVENYLIKSIIINNNEYQYKVTKNLIKKLNKIVKN